MYTTYLKGLELAELKEEDMPRFSSLRPYKSTLRCLTCLLL